MAQFNEQRGFGFISADGMPRDVFFHIRDVAKVVPQGNSPTLQKRTQGGRIRTPKAGDEVVFELIDTPKGPKAKTWALASSYDKVAQSMAPTAT